jgi:hypothetical protein
MNEVTEPNGSSVTYILRASSTFTMEHLRDAATRRDQKCRRTGTRRHRGYFPETEALPLVPCGEASAPASSSRVLPNTHGRGGSP